MKLFLIHLAVFGGGMVAYLYYFSCPCENRCVFSLDVFSPLVQKEEIEPQEKRMKVETIYLVYIHILKAFILYSIKAKCT